EVIMYRPYDSEKGKFIDHITNEFKGKNFIVNLTRNGFSTDKTLRVTQAIIEFDDANEIESKVLNTAEEAMKTVLNQDANFKGATLSMDGWFLGDADAFVEMDAKTNKVRDVINMGRIKEKVKTDKEITAKEAKEVVAPLAKKFFDIDITGYEVKWDDNTKNYRFVEYHTTKKGEKVEETIMRVTFDANKNILSLTSGTKAAAGGYWN
ncbi:hypothetical protein G8C92_31170, partial [Paenibacillus donghaensis]|nr:hypothetical protein [Paenibacillus donghaensis]